MNTNHNTNANNANNKTNGEKSMLRKLFTEDKTSLLYLIMIIAMLSSLLFLPLIVRACFVLLIVVASAMRITFYLSETKKNGFKRSVVGFVESIYTQKDFEKFRHGLAEELYKEMKNNAYVEISTEEQELEKDRAAMKAFLEKHIINKVVFDNFEKSFIADVALSLVGGRYEVGDCMFPLTLKHLVEFFNKTKEGLISDIHGANTVFDEMVHGLAYYCLDKSTQKEFRELRKRIHKAFCKEMYGEIMLYDYAKERSADFAQQDLAGEKEATFRC